MSVEVYSQTETSFMHDEMIREVEHDESEITCENKLAFTALCASCPLVALFGGCPKEIREDALYGPQEASTETGDDDFYLNTNESFVLAVMPVNQYSLEVPSEQLEISHIHKKEVEIQASPKREQLKTDDTDIELTELLTKKIPISVKKETVEPRRSYHDLLFDDSVAIVLASQLKRRKQPVKKTVTLATVDTVRAVYDEPAPIISNEVASLIPQTVIEIVIPEKKAPHTIQVLSDEKIVVKEVPLTPALIPQTAIVQKHIDKPRILAAVEKIDIPTIPIYNEVPAPAEVIVQIDVEPIDLVEERVVLDISVLSALELPTLEPLPTEQPVMGNSMKDEYPEEGIIIEISEIIPEIVKFQPVLVEDANQQVSETTKKEEATRTETSYSTIMNYIDTPEVLNNSVKISSSQQPWTVITLFGFIALLKLVTTNVSSKF